MTFLSFNQKITPLVFVVFGAAMMVPSYAQTAPNSTTAPTPDVKTVAIAEAPKEINWLNQDQAENQTWMVHAQNTDIVQGYPGYTSPYEGASSLPHGGEVRQTISLDLFLGAHLWPGGELYFDPEYYQGFGLGDTHGIASFSNGEAFKAGKPIGDVIIPRLFYRQIFGFGGEQEQISSDSLDLAKKVDISRLTITAGKFSVADMFDDNAYAHDGRSQFMAWTFTDSAGFDYAQDADGNTKGVVVDLNQKNWAIRWGHFQVMKVKNTHALDNNLLHAWEEAVEFDQRFSMGDHPGTARLIGFLMRAHIGSFSEALSTPDIDITESAQYRLQYGFALSADQEITKDFGLFARISWAQPNDDTYSFTDMSQGIAAGGQLQGTAWNRANDVVGLGDTVGTQTRAQATYYNNGGQGAVIGDGKLSEAPENVTEMYYNAQLQAHIHLTGDFQWVNNPGFNADRGPIYVFGARLHLDF